MKKADIYNKFKIVDVVFYKRNTMSLTTIKRNTNVFSIRIQGRAEFEYKDKRFYVDENSILFIPKDAQYTQFTDGEAIIAIHFKGHIGIDEMSVFNTQNVKLTAAFKEIFELWKAPVKAQGYKIYSVFYYILSEFQKLYDSPIIHNKISKGYYYIISNYTNPELKINSVAEGLGVSAAYFRKEFKKLYGISPKEKLIELRLQTAIALIKNEYCNITEAAQQSGFNNTSYFSTLFKKRYGISPHLYKEQ